MILRFINISLLAMMFALTAQAQLSPGELIQSHADLEGMFNCTQCHDLGNKVSNTKCLDCHKEIKTRVDKGQGFHASSEVKGKDCATCHSDHHGREFDAMRFDEDNFDHDLTGYELQGAHGRIDCRECHKADFVDDPELKKRERTFLGLDQDCISCHEDMHQNTLSTNDCAMCHSHEEFAPATYFDHDDTEYPLEGAHANVDCIECHQKETRNGKDFQVFTGVKFDNCIDCHDDVHEGNLGNNCKQCHSVESFTSLRRIRRFNHDRTNFPLKGKHKEVKCADCHNLNATLDQIFQDQMGIAINDCIQCHEDVHDNRFGSNCAECHNEKSFFDIPEDRFDHNLTDFPLVGKHRQVECKECHTESLREPLEHNTCAACHDDYHEGEFAINHVSPDCVECHTEDGFEGSLYTIEQHNESKFPLEGAHLATPCFACHISEDDDRWTFRNIGETCVDCHDDIHDGYLTTEYYSEQDCQKCHIADNWVENTFDHNLTEFELQGVHAETKCMDCHGVIEWTSLPVDIVGFTGLTNDCALCHENVHDDQFEENGVTDCARCHGFQSWGMEDFNHDNTAFPLDGAHAEVACEACHKPMESADGTMITQYKFERFECIDCHN